MVTSTKTEATDETTDSASTVLVQPVACDAHNELTNLLRSKVDKKDLTPELQSLLTEPAINADYMFAFAGEVNWPEDREITSVTAMEIEKERGVNLSECEMKEWSTGEPSGRKTEGPIASMSRVEQSPRSLVPRTKLLPGERLGWWSSQRYDKRKRMRALVKGAVNDVRTRILLDTGANVSVISANYCKRDSSTSARVDHHGWERVYEFEMWIMNHSAGVDVVLGTDFMIPAGVRLDLFHGTATLPDEVMVSLMKSLSAADDEPFGTQVVGGPTEGLYIPGELPREPGYVRLRSNKYKEWQILAYAESHGETLFERERELYECWLAEQPPAVERRAYPTPRNILTRDAEDPGPVDESQVYCAEDMTQATDPTGRECGRRDDSLAFRAVADASDGVAVEWIPTEESEHTKPVSESGDRVFEQAQRQYSTHATDDAARTESSNGIAAGVVSGRDAEENDVSEHLANDIELTDYAQELAFLPDLTEITVTALDYTGPNVQNKDLDVGQQQKLVDVLKRHEKIMISSGNALPPPAYGVACGIDVQGHAPIKQRARRTPLRFLGKLYELLKGLLRAVNSVTAIMAYAMSLVDDLLTDMEAYLWFCSLNAASGFWAIMMTQRARKISAFVCALGHFEWLRMPFGLTDIRLCIDYKMVNEVTAIMEYAMPLVDDLLTDMEARKISAFVCALGHFEWLRMPFGLKNAPMIYQRMIDNALWGFVQPKGGWSQFAKAMREVEEQTKHARTVATEDCNQLSEAPPRARTKFEADRESSTIMDAVSLLVNSPTGDMFANGESDASSLVPVFDRRSFVYDIYFGDETFDGCLATLDRLLQRFTECRISVSFTKSIFVQSKANFLSHEVSSEGIRSDPKKIKAVTEVPFPTSKKGMQSFLGALNYYSRFIQDFAVYGAALYQLKDADFAPGGDLTVAKRSFAALQQKVMDAPILRHFDRDKEVHVMLCANEWALSSTLMQEHDGKLHPVCYTQIAGRTIHVYTRFSALDWVHKSKTLFGRTTQFAAMLSPWHLVVQRVKERDCSFAQLLQAGLISFVDLDDSLAQVAPPTKGSPSIRMDPNLLYARLPRSYQGLVLYFDGSAKTEKHGGYGSCAWILWRLPEWTIVTEASAHLEATTVNFAEYAGMNNGVQAALEHTTEDLVIVGDSRLAIQQSLGVIASRNKTQLTQLNRHRALTAKLRSVKYLHVVREFNAAADSLASETLESKVSKVV
ncbi:hypothetical protein PHPALM_28793 [Phytophthora palmivora]|uniref:RNase H type-1 domain-containing protein n=1 Tax=Phytophthora palmivora TaxID=4796 RepID=A0A2P4X975_9STRA|nr:hypothetical protein PHPALM_28793 [Phytophthora palmivora]